MERYSGMPEELSPDVAKKAFAYFKERGNDFKQVMIQAQIKPDKTQPVPTSEDFRKWTMEEWAGFLYKYITPRKRK